MQARGVTSHPFDFMAKWVAFMHKGYSDSGKTYVWEVVAIEQLEQYRQGGLAPLGIVKWYGPWRRYCFFSTNQYGVYEQDCLVAIADFISTRTRMHREQRIDGKSAD